MPLTETLTHLEVTIKSLRRTHLANSASMMLLEIVQRALIELQHPEIIPNEEQKFFRKLERETV
jgi:hypothetical protein